MPNYKVVVRSMLRPTFSWAFVPNYPTAEPFNFAEPWNLRNCLSAQLKLLPNLGTKTSAQLPNLGTLPNVPNCPTKTFCRTLELNRLPNLAELPN